MTLTGNDIVALCVFVTFIGVVLYTVTSDLRKEKRYLEEDRDRYRGMWMDLRERTSEYAHDIDELRRKLRMVTKVIEDDDA